MRVRHKLPVKAGKRYRGQNSDLNPQFPNIRPQGSESSNQPSDLVPNLRWWSRHHNWYELDYIRNRLKLGRAFAEPISNVVTEYMVTRRTTLAQQIRAEFADLLGMAQDKL